MEGTAIILAGGESRRMGREKASIKISGLTLIERAARLLSPMFGRLIIVANGELGLSIPGVEIIGDLLPGRGPLGGIHAGLKSSKTEDNFVVACDMPFLMSSVVGRIRLLRGEADVAMARMDKGLEPLCASYSKRCLGAVEELIGAGQRRATLIFDKVNGRIVEPEEFADIESADRSFININTEAQLASALKLEEAVRSGAMVQHGEFGRIIGQARDSNDF